MPDLKNFKHIAIVQTAFLGDVALALPLAQVIKNYLPERQVTFVTTPISAPLVKVMKSVDNVIIYDKRDKNHGINGLRFLSGLLRQKNVDCIIAPHRSLRTTLLVKFANPLFSVGFDKNALSFLYKSKIKYNNDLHEIDRNLSLLKSFGDYELISPYFDCPIEFEIPGSDIEYTEKLINTNDFDSDKIILIAPGSVWNTKKWKEEYFIELINILSFEGYTCVLIGSRQEESLCRFIAGQSGAVVFAGLTTLPQLLHLLTKAKLLITNDSSPTHLAGIAGCPTITIFGPTVPEFGFGPRGKSDIVIQNNNLTCRPCRIHGSKKCPIRTHECMTSIKPTIVYNSATDILTNYK
jgi:heptosyltransferase II